MTPFTVKNLIPNFSYRKNVQGWFFTRNWTITFLRYSLTYSVILSSVFDEDRDKAHEKM